MASDAQSEYSVALNAAYGLDAAQDLKGALRHLQVAADLGHQPARAELAALVGNWRLVGDIRSGKPVPPDMWQRLRSAVDVGAWSRVPDARRLSLQPRIAMLKRLISPGACDWLIALARPHLERQQTLDPESGEKVDHSARTNSGAELLPGRFDSVVAFVRARVAAVAGVSTGNLDTSQVLHYAVGEQFAPHYDFLSTQHPGYARQVAEWGQRAYTVLIYLNDDFEGGETYFPRLERGFKGRKGDALLFWNVTPEGAPDRLTLHMGAAPTRGEKWLFSQWIRVRP
ncbi:MAG TPA: 2OG-Fe(II) oxygenase [Planctomycetota bacterium]|nr:2OG-Fe(II) oxygenase [Planctomycetota bacterium]